MHKCCLIATLSLLSSAIYADDERGAEAKAQPGRISLRHIEAGGIGYSEGYTSLDFFLSTNQETFVPFLDLRGHVFDNGKLASNAGLGARYLYSGRIYGLEVYYDYRQGRHLKDANQIGISLETLGAIWDVRINGYIPFGKRKSPVYHPEFSHFSGNEMILKAKTEFSMAGVNAEGGGHVWHKNNWDFYAAAGPYYFNGEGKNVYGGQARISTSYRDYIKLEISDSYDNVFHNNFQGQITLSVPFGPRSKIQREYRNNCQLVKLDCLMVQPVIRDEIIVLDKTKKHSAAIDPANGLPYHFIFVNNLSHSEGTFESPYPTLSEAIGASAPYDIIYVFSGDGTSKGLNAGNYILQNDQQLLGSGVSHIIPTTLGSITIPQLTSNLPQLSNPAGSSQILNLKGTSNIVSGLMFTMPAASSTANAILAVDVGTLTIANNQFDINNNQTGILSSHLPPNPTLTPENLTLCNNTFGSSDFLGQAAIVITDGSTASLYTINNNTISGFQNTVAIRIGGENSSSTISVSQNTIHNCSDGIYITNAGNIAPNVFVSNNTITYPNIPGSYGIYFNIGTNTATFSPTSVCTMTNNTIQGFSNGKTPYGIYFEETLMSTNTLISGNTINNCEAGIQANASEGAGILNIQNNRISNNTSNALKGISLTLSSINSLTSQISENTINGFFTGILGNFQYYTNVVIQNNNIQSSLKNSAGINFAATTVLNPVLLAGNTINGCPLGIFGVVSEQTGTTLGGPIQILGNIMNVPNTGITLTSTNSSNPISIAGNTINNPIVGVTITSTNSAAINTQNNMIFGTSQSNTGILYNITNPLTATLVSGNTVNSFATGILFQEPTGTQPFNIVNNSITSPIANSVGITFVNGSTSTLDSLIYENTINDCSLGIGGTTTNLGAVQIQNNTINANTSTALEGIGLSITGATNTAGQITGNTVTNYPIGILLQESSYPGTFAIQNNTITGPLNIHTSYGIYAQLTGTNGALTLASNNISEVCAGINVDMNPSTTTVNVMSNTITVLSETTSPTLVGIAVSLESNSAGTFTLDSNTITMPLGTPTQTLNAGIHGTLSNTSVASFSVASNTLSGGGAAGVAVLLTSADSSYQLTNCASNSIQNFNVGITCSSSGGASTFTLSENNFTQIYNPSIYIVQSSSTNGTIASITNNSLAATAGSPVIQNLSSGNLQVTLQNNAFLGNPTPLAGTANVTNGAGAGAVTACFTGNTVSGFSFNNQSTAAFDLTQEDNTGPPITLEGTIAETTGPCP